ncbi:hypothetical protein MKW98_015910, partial [Papaver atlanticum]
SPLLSGFIRAATHQLIRMSRRSVVPPSKEWIYAPKYSPRWVPGVQSFIQFTRDSLGEASNEVRCPCMKCKIYNSLPKSLEDVHGDILENGFDMTYQTWIHHGEQPSDHVFNVEAPPPLPANHVVNEDAPVSRMHYLFTETLGRAVGVNNFENFHNNSDCPPGADVEDGSGGNNQDRASVNYSKRLQDAAQPLYPEELRLKWGKKYAYMGHRKFLRDRSHPYRRQKSQFNGKQDYRGAPSRLSGVDLFEKTATADKEFGKLVKRPVKVKSPWSKRSILFCLSYWKFLHVRHNVDVMHVEKNFAENLFGTFMNYKDKSKDGVPARKDLKLLKLKPSLWLRENNRKLVAPHAPYRLSDSERKVICKTLSTLKVPIGYSGNWRKKKTYIYLVTNQMCRMMRTYKVYGRNKNYIEASIQKQYEVIEGARHCTKFFHEGKPYELTTLEYDQVRIWILRHSDENTEWEAKYNAYLSNLNRTHKGRTETMDYIPWLRGQLEGTPVTDFRRIAIGPTDLTRKHWNLVLEFPIRSDPHMNAFEDPYVFTATSSDAPLISETVGDDDYWSRISQELALAECTDDEYSDGDA